MFKKFLFFTVCLLTLASQNGYAALELEQPKAVLQRGSYTKLTLNFTISNISPQDLVTYEMGGATTEAGIRSLTRYLDICVQETSGKKCTQGPGIFKVRYSNNTDVDKTPSTELSADYSASFTNGSPQFTIVPESDSTATYHDMSVTIELTATPSKPFSTNSYIALRLLPGTQTSSTDYKDKEVKPTLAVAIDGVFDQFEVRPSKGTLTAIWNKDENLHRANGDQSPADGALVFIVEERHWIKQNIPLSTYNEANPSAEIKLEKACYIQKKTETTCDMDCSLGTTGSDKHYLKAKDLEAAGYSAFESGNTGYLSIPKLDNKQTYAVIIQAQPDGLKHSCLISKPSDAVTLSELGGGDEPKLKDPRCFIATAAYGSSLDPRLNTLRWFRDHVLMVTGFGRKLVQLYYDFSPPLAGFIAAHPTLKAATRGALWGPVIMIEFWRERPALMLTFSALVSAFLFLLMRRRSLMTSV